MKRVFLHHRLSLAAAVFLLALVLIAAAAPLLVPYDPFQIDLDRIKQAPGWDHPFGTDDTGRDTLSRVIYGTRISLTVGVTAASISMVIGLIVGLTAGYFGGRIDAILSMILDIVLAFPGLLLVIGVSVILPPGIGTALLALSLVGWAPFARLYRGMATTLRNQPYVEAARAAGGAHLHILATHLFPNVLPMTGVLLMMKMGGFILAEAALSFLGLGAQPPTPSWGAMISLDRIFIHSAPWMVIFPGLAITVTVMALNIVGDALRDYWDPQQQVKE